MDIYAAKVCAKNLLKEAAEATSLGHARINETPHKEEQALLRESRSMPVTDIMVWKATKAGRADDWLELELMKSDELNSWMMVKLRVRP